MRIIVFNYQIIPNITLRFIQIHSKHFQQNFFFKNKYINKKCVINVMNNKILNELHERYFRTADFVRKSVHGHLETAIIAGSGIASAFDKSKISDVITYSILPEMPQTKVEGHSGEILIYNSGGKNSIIFSGRFHFYEGRNIHEILSLVSIAYFAGCRRIIITNAAGGLKPDFKPGNVMLIDDVIDLMFLKNCYSPNSLENFDNKVKIINEQKKLYNNYNAELIKKSISIKTGVYVAVSGPNYETRAEIRMLRKIGADAVGMSTVPEFKFALNLGMETIGLSLITNSAKEILQNVSHEEVIEVASQSSNLVKDCIETAIEL